MIESDQVISLVRKNWQTCAEQGRNFIPHLDSFSLGVQQKIFLPGIIDFLLEKEGISLEKRAVAEAIIIIFREIEQENKCILNMKLDYSEPNQHLNVSYDVRIIASKK